MSDDLKGYDKAQAAFDAQMPEDADDLAARKMRRQQWRDDHAYDLNDERRDDARDWAGREYP